MPGRLSDTHVLLRTTRGPTSRLHSSSTQPNETTNNNAMIVTVCTRLPLACTTFSRGHDYVPHQINATKRETRDNVVVLCCPTPNGGNNPFVPQPNNRQPPPMTTRIFGISATFDLHTSYICSLQYMLRPLLLIWFDVVTESHVV